MRAAAIGMEPPCAKDLAPRVFAEGNQRIEALPTEASESPVTQRVRLRRVDRRAEAANTPRRDGRVESGRVAAVAIVEDDSGGVRGRENLPALLQGPSGGGMPRPGDGPRRRLPPSSMPKTERTRNVAVPATQQSQAPRAWAWFRTTVAHRGAGRALPSPAEPAAQGAVDGARRDAEAELHEEFGGDPLLAPSWITSRHPRAQALQVRRKARVSRVAHSEPLRVTHREPADP